MTNELSARCAFFAREIAFLTTPMRIITRKPPMARVLRLHSNTVGLRAIIIMSATVNSSMSASDKLIDFSLLTLSPSDERGERLTRMTARFKKTQRLSLFPVFTPKKDRSGDHVIAETQHLLPPKSIARRCPGDISIHA